MKRLSNRILAELKEAGFVHVTNLKYIYQGNKEHRIEAPQDCWGTFAINSMMYCLVTMDGQVWVGPSLSESMRALVDNLCPEGYRDNSGWSLAIYWIDIYIVNRLVDPYLGIRDVEPADEPDEDFEDALSAEVFAAPLEEVALDPRDDKGERLVYQKGIRNP